MSLKSDIAAWDGKSAADIRAVYADHAHTRGFLARLVKLAADRGCEVGATWLVKHHLETDTTVMNSSVAETWYACVKSLTHWEARLHLLQCMPHVPVPKSCVRQVRTFLDECIASEHKFVRAWAYTGYCELARAHPRFRAQALELLDDGERHDPAASVRARIRQQRKAAGLARS